MTYTSNTGRSHTQSWLSKGFTLIELLVVVLIIGILAAVAVPQYQKAVKKAHGREVLEAVSVLDKGFTEYYLQHGSYLGTTPSIGNVPYGPSAEELTVTPPELKYFEYDAINFPRGSRFQVGSITNGVLSVSILEKKSRDVSVSFNHANGKMRGFSCGPASKCGDYFNCRWNVYDYQPCAVCPTYEIRECLLD